MGSGVEEKYQGVGVSCPAFALQSNHCINMHSNPVDLTVDCNQSVPVGADAKKIVEPKEPAAESVSNSNTDVNGTKKNGGMSGKGGATCWGRSTTLGMCGKGRPGNGPFGWIPRTRKR